MSKWGAVTAAHSPIVHSSSGYRGCARSASLKKGARVQYGPVLSQRSAGRTIPTDCSRSPRTPASRPRGNHSRRRPTREWIPEGKVAERPWEPGRRRAPPRRRSRHCARRLGHRLHRFDIQRPDPDAQGARRHGCVPDPGDGTGCFAVLLPRRQVDRLPHDGWLPAQGSGRGWGWGGHARGIEH